MLADSMERWSSRCLPGRAALVALVLAATWAVSTPAFADDADPRARASRSFDEARAAFRRRDFAAAAAAFELAAKLAPHPTTWLNAAEAWQALGDDVRAAEDCDRALAIADMDPPTRAEAESRLARSAPKIATLDVRGERGLTLSIDGGEAMTPPQRRRLPPGAHELVVTDVTSGRKKSEKVTLEAGSTRAFDLEPFPSLATSKPVTMEPRPPSRSAGPPLPSIIAFGAAGVFLGVTATFGVLTLSEKGAYDESPARDELDRFRDYRAVTNIALGAAAVSAIVGGILWAVSPRTEGR